MADKIGTEVSGLPLISDTNGEGLESGGSVSITIESPLGAQKSMLSEAAILSEVERAKMSSVRKRNGMKVVFRVRVLWQIACWEAHRVWPRYGSFNCSLQLCRTFSVAYLTKIR